MNTEDGDEVSSGDKRAIPPSPPPEADFSWVQSVRTTFKVSEDGEKALEWLAQKDGITLKEVIESLARLLSNPDADSSFSQYVFARAKSIDDSTARRKTYVLSKGALADLGRLARDHSVTRDAVLEASAVCLQASLSSYARHNVQVLEEAEQIAEKMAHHCSEAEARIEELLSGLTLDSDFKEASPEDVVNQFVCGPIEEALRYWRRVAGDVGASSHEPEQAPEDEQ